MLSGENNEMKNNYTITLLTLLTAVIAVSFVAESATARPNILFCISDDQSYAHAGANGDPVVAFRTK
jgi:hypothetical protein